MSGSERLKGWLKFLLALAFSIFFSVLFIREVDLAQVGEALAGADYVYVVPALGLFALSLVFRAWRWRLFLQPRPGLGWRQLLPSLLVGYAGNNLLPLRAGELLRAQHLAERHGVARMQTFGTLVMERLFDGLILAVFLLWGMLLVDVGPAYFSVGLMLAGGTLAGFVVCAAIAHRPELPARAAALPLPFLTLARRETIAGLGQSFVEGFEVLRRPTLFGLAGLASAAAWSLELAMYWLIGRAFDLPASLLTIAFAGSAANVAMSLPSAQGGVGPFQYFATQALVKFEVAAAPAGAYALALHVLLVVPVSLAGLAVLWRAALPWAARRRVAPALDAPDG